MTNKNHIECRVVNYFCSQEISDEPVPWKCSSVLTSRAISGISWRFVSMRIPVVYRVVYGYDFCCHCAVYSPTLWQPGFCQVLEPVANWDGRTAKMNIKIIAELFHHRNLSISPKLDIRLDLKTNNCFIH